MEEVAARSVHPPPAERSSLRRRGEVAHDRGGWVMYLRIAAIPVLALALSAPAMGAVPPPLAQALAEHGCLQIADGAEVLRNRAAWWVSLSPFTGGDGDFAFFCQSATEPLFSRLVVVVRGENNPWRDCDAIVDSWREQSVPWFPYDLAVVRAATQHARHTDLGRWWLVSSSSDPTVTYGPAGVKVPDPVIDTTGGRAGALYACYSSRWYRIGLD